MFEMRGVRPARHVRDLLDRQLVDIEEQLARLSLLRATISGLRAHAAQTTSETCAPESVWPIPLSLVGCAACLRQLGNEPSAAAV